MKVLVVDDESLVSDLVTDYLKSLGVVSEVFQKNDISGIEEFIKINSVDLVFLDLYMPQLVGFDILKEIRDNLEDIKVVILSSHFQAKYIQKALDLKANAFLSKSINKSEISKTLEHIAEGKIYLCSECYREIELSKMKMNNDKFNISELITNREVEILREIANGLSSQEIGDKLFISKTTVETHKKNLYEKFGVSKITQLVKVAVENNVI
jgi:DNA-binding NarL/FixJ family response regulator